jgi:serine/threonine protein kinase
LKLSWLHQIATTLASLHDFKIFHGDIKPENCLLDQNLNVLLCDFNSAMQLDSSRATTRFSRGSCPFLSPEAINTNERGFPCDIWAFGCLTFELFTSQCPFKAETEYLSMQKVDKNDFQWVAPLLAPEDRISADAESSGSEKIFSRISDLISKCWNRDPQLRITAKEALQHPVFSCMM